MVAFSLEKLIIFVNSIKRKQPRTFLGLTSETTICNNLTAKVLVKCSKWFAIVDRFDNVNYAVISIFRNAQDHKLD